MSLPYAGLTMVCLASYFKGSDFLVECHRQGAVVILMVREKAADEAWPRDSIDEIVAVPDHATPEMWLDAITGLARQRRLDRVVALEEYDVMNAALVREHLRVPGMGTSTARLFRDKLAMRVKASETGVRVPAFVPLMNDADIAAFMDSVPPPWVLKPRMDVSAIGIQKLDRHDLVWHAVRALDARPALTERASYFLLEQFIGGEVFHVDSLVQDSRIVFASVSQYRRPPMEVAHNGGVFVTSTVRRDSHIDRALVATNERLIGAMGFRRGATHAEFIRSSVDGQIHFLEVAARVGGAFIADMLEAATGTNLWCEWAKIELARDQFPYELHPGRQEYGGIALALARQEWPDTSGYTDPEISIRPRKRHHAGLIVRSPSFDRVQELLEGYADRFVGDFLAVLPPRQRAE
jgi:biotin carboxylase